MPAIPLSKAVYAISEEELQKLQQRKPIMPKQNRPLTKKGKQAAPKPAIKIAKPEMTLTGFEHTKESLKEKARLTRKSIEHETKSESRRSRSQSVRSRDLRNPDSESESGSDFKQSFGIGKGDAPPMN